MLSEHFQDLRVFRVSPVWTGILKYFLADLCPNSLMQVGQIFGKACFCQEYGIWYSIFVKSCFMCMNIFGGRGA